MSREIQSDKQNNLQQYKQNNNKEQYYGQYKNRHPLSLI